MSSLSAPDPFREVLDDVRTELRERRAQVLAVLTYLVLGAGGLVLFSSTGEDSRQWYDTMQRTTLAVAGIVILAVGILLGVVTLVVDRDVRRRAKPYGLRRHLRSRRHVVLAMAAGAALIALGFFALSRWDPAPTQPEVPTDSGSPASRLALR